MKALPFLAACALLGATGTASANTITVSWTQSGVAHSGPVVSLSLNIAGSTASFSEVPDVLSPVIDHDVTAGTLISELDFAVISPSTVEMLAFQTVTFTAFTPGTPGVPPLNPNDVVSFSFSTVTETITVTPLPAALPLFATGIGGLGLLGWRRKRKARAVGTKAAS